jgi:uncharacterized protein
MKTDKPAMTVKRALIASCLLLPAVCAATIVFPPLTGRVVDLAGKLTPLAEQSLTQQLAAHEQATTNQIVVVTLPTLQGYTIEEFGYQLGRHWGIGQQDKNNGVLLLVAPTERVVRIEVGYGLEGVLTDALASDIIHNNILPRFRRGDFEGGIEQGTASILAAIRGEYIEQGPSQDDIITYFGTIFLFLFFILLIYSGYRQGDFFFMKGSHRGRSSGSSGHFGGGGGSFGGGGASGRW